MIAVGVDCGKNKVHMVLSNGTHFKTEMASGTPRDKSLQTMRDEIKFFLHRETDHDIRLYVEAPVVAGARNLQASLDLAETVGMVLSLGFPATLVPISTWKQKVVGSGNAKKEDVERWYKDSGGSLRGQDFYDAAAICAYGRKDLEIAEQLRRGLLSSTGEAEVPEHGQALARVARKG